MTNRTDAADRHQAEMAIALYQEGDQAMLDLCDGESTANVPVTLVISDEYGLEYHPDAPSVH